MRIATKYSMEEVQAAVVRVVQSKTLDHTSSIGEAIATLCFTAEFPGHFLENHVREAFIKACDTEFYPSIEDLERLMAHPGLLVAMMKYREGKLEPKNAVWKSKQAKPIDRGVARSSPKDTLAEVWLSEELRSLRLIKPVVYNYIDWE